MRQHTRREESPAVGTILPGASGGEETRAGHRGAIRPVEPSRTTSAISQLTLGNLRGNLVEACRNRSEPPPTVDVRWTKR